MLVVSPDATVLSLTYYIVYLYGSAALISYRLEHKQAVILVVEYICINRFVNSSLRLKA